MGSKVWTLVVAAIALIACGGGGGAGGGSATNGSTNGSANGSTNGSTNGGFPPEGDYYYSQFTVSISPNNLSLSGNGLHGDNPLNLDHNTISYPLNFNIISLMSGQPYGSFTGTLERRANGWHILGLITLTAGGTQNVHLIKEGNEPSFPITGGLTVAGTDVLASSVTANSLVPGPGGVNYRHLFSVPAGTRMVYFQSGAFIKSANNVFETDEDMILTRSGVAISLSSDFDGNLPEPLALPQGSYELTYTNTAGWVDSFDINRPIVVPKLGFSIAADGTCTFPTSISGEIPRVHESFFNLKLTFTTSASQVNVKFADRVNLSNINLNPGNPEINLTDLLYQSKIWRGGEMSLTFLP